MQLGALVGQDLAKAVLRRAVAGGHVPHAYLFEGPAGVGKRSTALGLALALACPVKPREGCGACDTCRRIESGLHPDVPTFVADGAFIVMEQAQAMVSLAQTRPHEAPARVIIVDDADRLNLNAANCLLKALEEPHAGTHFVLCTTAPERMLSTIRSRMQRVRFKALAVETLVSLATAQGVAPERAAVAAVLADGSIGATLTAASADGDGDLWAAIDELEKAAAARDVGPVFDAASAVAGDKENKQELPRTLALLARIYRDALVSAAGAPELALFGERASALAARGVPALGRALGAIVEADLALAANTNAVTAVERLLLALRRRPEARGAAR
ncbi:MAG TPA: DNA polymerase III subunit delta' [Polyangia bacterium]|jgi:DNA polymerase-3 subunit delta'|nr:DNA polymerase III subunit delta' [Polyangia bacterium]